MVRFQDLSLKSKQIAAFGLVMLIVAASSIYALRRLQLMKNDIDEVSRFWLKRSEAIDWLAINVALVRLNQVQMAGTGDETRRKSYAEASISRLDSVNVYWDHVMAIRLDSLDRPLDDEEKAYAIRESALLDELENEWDAYLGELLFFLDPEVRMDEPTRTRVFDASEGEFRAVAVSLGNLADLNQAAWKVSERRAEQNYRNAQLVTRVLFLGAILFSIAIIAVLVRLISRPVGELTRAAARVAEGDRSVWIPVASKDEIGRLSRSFNRMTAALREQEAELLRRQTETEEKNEALEAALEKLRATQQQLVVREKMASLGQLTAGIAHEIKNPLNFVNNFAKLSKELIADLIQELEESGSRPASEVLADVQDLLSDLSFNAERIEEHGGRADSIVRNMLLHSRGKPGEKVMTDMNQLLDEYVALAFHGMRGADSSFNSEYSVDLDENVGQLEVVPQNLGRAFLNILNNAFYAVGERARSEPGSNGYEPTVRVSSRRDGDRVVFSFQDNGNGIDQDVVDRIFEPFFTTKPTGSGTGLGLSLVYDIVTKEHGGEIDVDTKPGSGTTFTVTLPG